MTNRFWVFLLLGSYDNATLKVLDRLKDQLSERLMNESDYILIFLLDNIRLYLIETQDGSGRTQKMTIIAEEYARKVSVITLVAATVLDAIDISITRTSNIDKLVRDYFEKKYKIINFRKLGILEKLKELSATTSMIFLLRDQELTRGGEYIELAYLLGLKPSRGRDFYVFKREGFQLSEMAWEILSEYKVSYRSYVNEDGLINEATRIALAFIGSKGTA